MSWDSGSLRCKRFQNYVITLKSLRIILSDVLTAIKLCFNNFLRRHIKQLSENKHLLYIDFPFSALVFEYLPFTYSQHLRNLCGGVFILFPQLPKGRAFAFVHLGFLLQFTTTSGEEGLTDSFPSSFLIKP